MARHVFVRPRRLQGFIHKTLMRRMLIDDDESIAGLRDDIVVVDLRPRGAERRFDILWRGCLRMGACVGGDRFANERKIAEGRRTALGKPRIGRGLPPIPTGGRPGGSRARKAWPPREKSRAPLPHARVLPGGALPANSVSRRR